jgi:hypothetical protein
MLEKGKPTLSRKEAVEWALTLNKTIKSQPRNQEKGLDNINSFLLANKSHWVLFSGDIRMVSNLGGFHFFSNPIGPSCDLSLKVQI